MGSFVVLGKYDQQVMESRKFYDDLCLHRCVTDKLGNPPDYKAAFDHLFQVEGEIVRENYFFKVGRGVKDDLKMEVGRYVPLRERMVEAIGEDKFSKLYGQYKAKYNEREKEDGDFGLVLPEFNADGTHEPTDEKHVAWDGPFWGGNG